MVYIRCTVKHPQVNCPPVRCPLFFASPVKSPWIKRLPGQTPPSGQTTIPVLTERTLYSVYYVIIVTGIEAMLFKINIKNDIMQLKNVLYSRDIANKTRKTM